MSRLAEDRFETEYTVYGYEISPRGHLRPSALARFAQQAAGDELRQLARRGVRTQGLSWVVRRNVLRGWRRVPWVSSLQLVRRITGVGSCWLEAHTEVLHRDRPLGVSVRAFWVQLDMATQRPAPVDPLVEKLCLAAGGDPELTWRSELRLGELALPRHEVVPVREADYDALGHVNNSVVLDLVEHLAPAADELVVEYDVSLDWGTEQVALDSGEAAPGVTAFRLSSTTDGTRYGSGVLRSARDTALPDRRQPG